MQSRAGARHRNEHQLGNEIKPAAAAEARARARIGAEIGDKRVMCAKPETRPRSRAGAIAGIVSGQPCSGATVTTPRAAGSIAKRLTSKHPSAGIDFQ